jgi:FKBP-type peptidyl-prolyl cis-trans isomerase
MRASVVSLFACIAVCASAACRNMPVRSPEQAVEVRTSRGVVYEDLALGQGTSANVGDELLLDYTAWLESGERVDSTLDRGSPVLMRIGAALVRGLDEGLIGMRVDGRRRITVPSELAYGETGVEGMIPPDQNLVFEVHVIEVHVSAQRPAQ